MRRPDLTHLLAEADSQARAHPERFKRVFIDDDGDEKMPLPSMMNAWARRRQYEGGRHAEG